MNHETYPITYSLIQIMYTHQQTVIHDLKALKNLNKSQCCMKKLLISLYLAGFEVFLYKDKEQDNYSSITRDNDIPHRFNIIINDFNIIINKFCHK